MERLGKVGRLELTYHFCIGEDLSDDLQEGSEDKPLTGNIKNALLSAYQYAQNWWLSSVGPG